MANANCESPLRRFAANDNTPTKNSPVEVNRLKTLLRKKVGDDSVQGTPKKATPRKEVKVKRDKTMKLCSSCVHHNKDVCVTPVNTEGQVAKKKRAPKKNAADGSSEGQGENPNANDGTKSTVEKKAATKKPRETKKKLVTQEEKLDVPSTSGTVPSQLEGSELTDSGNSKPKRQRKKVHQPTEQNEPESLPDKKKESKKKGKNIIKVKVPMPKKTTISSQHNETAPFQNMDVTDLANSNQPSDYNEMQGAAEKVDVNTKTKVKTTGKTHKVTFETTADVANASSHETAGNPEGLSVVNEKALTQTKTKNATKPQVSQSNKNSVEDDENMHFENLNVTDLVNSIVGEQKREKNAMNNGASTSKSKSRVMVEASGDKNLITEHTLFSMDGASENSVELASVTEKTASKGKGKSNDPRKIKGSRQKKTDKNLPEDNDTAPFENMNITDLVNSTVLGQGVTENKSVRPEDESKTTIRRNTYIIEKRISTGSQLISESEVLNNPTTSTNNNHKEFAESEDMFKDDSVGTIEEGIEEMTLSSSDKTVRNKENAGNSSNSMYYTQGDVTHDPIATILTPAAASNNPLDDLLFDFNVNTNGEEMYTQKLKETSAGEKINLSSSTTLSRHDVSERSSINLDNVDDGSHSNIHDDDTVDRLGLDSFVTVRPRGLQKHQSDLNKKNTRNGNGTSNFTLEDCDDDTLHKISDENDENQQPSTPDIELLTHLKTERDDTVYVNNMGRNLSSNNSPTTSLRTNGTNVSTGERQNLTSTSIKSNSKLKEPKSPVNNVDTSEPEEKKSKKSKKDAVLESPKKSKKKSVEKPMDSSSDEESKSSKAKLKLKKNNEELCAKHEKVKDCDEKVSRRTAKKKSKKHLKVDMKMAKAMESMSKIFSRMSVGTNIGTIEKLHIGRLSSDSDSSDECPSDCSCKDSSCESNSSGDKCKCWKCLMEQSDSSCECDESSTSEDDSSDESNSSDSSSTTSSSSEESEKTHRSIKKSAKEKKIVKPTYKDKLKMFCSKYDLRSNTSKYDLRSRDTKK